MGSVADISKQYALGIYKDRILQDFGNINLDKKPLDINYITDIQSLAKHILHLLNGREASSSEG